MAFVSDLVSCPGNEPGKKSLESQSSFLLQLMVYYGAREGFLRQHYRPGL